MITKDGTIRYLEPVTQMLYKYDREIQYTTKTVAKHVQAVQDIEDERLRRTASHVIAHTLYQHEEP